MEFVKWKSIGKFPDVVKLAGKTGVSSIIFKSKIKLHGTNAAIQFDGKGEIKAQKRSDFITPQNDNAGFASYVESLDIVSHPNSPMILYGEWAGPGVQKGDAVSMIDEKHFFVFSVYSVEHDSYITEPHSIESVIVGAFGEDYIDKNIRVLPWYDDVYEDVKFDFGKDPQNFLNSLVNEVDNTISKEDPYIKEEFGVSGPGEGLVVYPIFVNNKDYHKLDFVFKVKTEAHSVQKQKNRKNVGYEKPEGVDEFIGTFFTEARFEQMLNEIGGEAIPKKTGEFLKAVMSDVHKESKNEIELADFEWKDVPKYAAPTVKKWWFDKCNEI